MLLAVGKLFQVLSYSQGNNSKAMLQDAFLADASSVPAGSRNMTEEQGATSEGVKAKLLEKLQATNVVCLTAPSDPSLEGC